MYTNLKVLALITARGGSKGLPMKNLRPLGGRPLIQWSIEVALACNTIDVVLVSTDDEQIAAVARTSGAEVPFLRPPALAEDTASSIDVVIHALDYMQNHGRIFDIILLLEPTSPLREVEDINGVLKLLVDGGSSAVVTVCRAESVHPVFMFRCNEEGRLSPFLSIPPTGIRRQDIEPLYYPDGTIYASWVHAIRNRRSFYHDDTLPFEIEKWKSLEVDDIEDFQMIEAIAMYRGLA